MPCWRMHRAILTSFAIVCAVAGAPEPGRPPPRSLVHFARAASNAGDDGSIAPPTWKVAPSEEPGSGKLVTPFERMHLANASPPVRKALAMRGPELAALAVELCELLPHPATSRRAAVASSVARTRLRCRSVAVERPTGATFYDPVGNRPVTRLRVDDLAPIVAREQPARGYSPPIRSGGQ